ncbi:hypothetical protein D3C74_406670 [compost metagenome]
MPVQQFRNIDRPADVLEAVLPAESEPVSDAAPQLIPVQPFHGMPGCPQPVCNQRRNRRFAGPGQPGKP